MICFIQEPAKRRAIAAKVLADLPQWFGLPESTQAYVRESGGLPFWAWLEAGEPVGFIACKETSPHTGEIYVMGVMQAYHRRGIGRRLFEALKRDAFQKGYGFLQVKTVAKGCYPQYDQTRLFYESLGFRWLECFPTLWDTWNPCLVLVMALNGEDG